MPESNWGWVDEDKKKEGGGGAYFNIVEGPQQFILLSEFARLAQVWDGKKYRPAEEGDTNVSIKGVCWVAQDGVIKQAKMPYTVVKAIRELAEDEAWEFTEFPFPHVLTLKAKNVGTKEARYSITPSPKKVDIPAAILEELKKKPTPESIVERIKGVKQEKTPEGDYPAEDINPDDIPW